MGTPLHITLSEFDAAYRSMLMRSVFSLPSTAAIFARVQHRRLVALAPNEPTSNVAPIEREAA